MASGEVSQAAAGFLVAESNVEYIDAGADVGLLQKIANGSGGKFYPDTDADQLVNDLKRRQKAVTVESQQDIWDIPPVLLTLFALLTVEWWVRRRRGMS